MVQEGGYSWDGRSEDREELVNEDNDQIEPNDQYSNDDEIVEQVYGKPAVYTSQWATLFIIVNVTVGVSLLALPFTMQSSGIIIGMIVQLAFLALIVITCIICTELTVKSQVNSYHQIIQKHCHSYIYQFTQISIILLVFGTSVAFIVTIGDQFDRLFASVYGSEFGHHWYMDRRFIMTMFTFIGLKPLCSARTVDFLKYASFLGILSIGFLFYVVSADFIHAEKVSPTVNYLPKSWGDITAILPSFALGYQCHLSLVPTVATIRRSEKPRAFITTAIAMIVVAVIYSAISILAVLRYGSDIKKDLTESFTGKDPITYATIVIIALKAVLTLPAAYLPARLSILDILCNNWSRFAQLGEPTRRIGLTIVFLDVALISALLVPDILVAISVLGFLAVMFIFQLPGLAYLSLVKQNRLEKQVEQGLDAEVPNYTARDKMKLVASYFLIVFGSLVTLVVLYESIKEFTTNTPSPPLDGQVAHLTKFEKSIHI